MTRHTRGYRKVAYTREEMAVLLRVNVRTISRWAKTGHGIVATRYGYRTVRYHIKPRMVYGRRYRAQ